MVNGVACRVTCCLRFQLSRHIPSSDGRSFQPNIPLRCFYEKVEVVTCSWRGVWWGAVKGAGRKVFPGADVTDCLISSIHSCPRSPASLSPHVNGGMFPADFFEHVTAHTMLK